jgi:hypothetical protein
MAGTGNRAPGGNQGAAGNVDLAGAGSSPKHSRYLGCSKTPEPSASTPAVERIFQGRGKAPGQADLGAPSMNAPIVRLRRLRGCAKPWRVMLAGARREIAVSSRALVTPRLFQRTARSQGIEAAELDEREWLCEVGRALQSAEIEAA